MKRLNFKFVNAVKLFLRIIVVMILILFLTVSFLILSHPYVWNSIESVVSTAIDEWFVDYPNDVLSKKLENNNESNTVNDRSFEIKYSLPSNDSLSFAEVTNTIALMSMLIDLRSEPAVRSFVIYAPTVKTNSFQPFVEWLKSKQLDELEIRKQISKLLSETPNDRRIAKPELISDIISAQWHKNDAPSVQGTIVHTWKRWGVTMIGAGSFPEESSSLKKDQLLSIFISSYFKAILYDEVQSVLLKTPDLYWNQFISGMDCDLTEQSGSMQQSREQSESNQGQFSR